MKLKGRISTLLLLGILALIVAFVGVTCVNQNIEMLGTEANLTALRIESGDVTDTASKVADPIPASVMDKEDLTANDLYGLDYDQPGTTIGWADIRVRNKETGKINGRLRPTVSKGARAQWGIGTRSTRPDLFYDTRVPATLDNDEYIYIRVASEDGETVNYYRFYAKLLSWTTNLQYIRITRKLADGSPDLVNPPREGKAGSNIHGKSAGASSWDKILGMPSDAQNTDGTPKFYTPLTFSIAQKEGQNVVVDVVTFDPNATVKYAVADNETTEPTNFKPTDQPLELEDQKYLYVEVTAENTLDKEYFRFTVSVGRLANIASLKFNGKDGKDVDIYGLGLPQTDWDTVGPGEYKTADQPQAGFGIKLVPDDPDAKIVYEKIANDAAGQPAAFSSTATIRFDNPQTLAIKVTSANSAVTMFYKVRVTNLAANILEHPKSAWYYSDKVVGGVSAEGNKPVVPLTVKLDRNPSGPLPYEYQWYEADSWYGIYGRHGTSIDEKNNIATVNGGPGQYFYLVQGDELPYSLKPDGYEAADWAKAPRAFNTWPSGTSDYYWADYNKGGEPMAWSLTGETGPSYLPPINWEDETITFYPGATTAETSYPIKPVPPKVNFFSGSTNESRYYWVKVTDPNNGLVVVSERALILTETEPKMDHFIFDLATLPKKNIVPFTKEGTAYDNIYKIDVKNYPFPADFNDKVEKFQVCIAHAQYFLPDGRPWTQNWTHGNFHMGMDDGSLIWYQNNMGANGGAIPLQAPHSSQGGLIKKPDWIGFTPSGDPAKGLPPPINAAGDLPKGIYSMNQDKYPAGVAQGYFAAFIELLEVRFQTPPP